MRVKFDGSTSPPMNVYAVPGAALAILVAPTNPVVTAADDATITAAPNRIRNFILLPSSVMSVPKPHTAPQVRDTLASSLRQGQSSSRPEKVLASPPLVPVRGHA